MSAASEALAGAQRAHGILGRPHWESDSNASSCRSCTAEFTIFKRRHHCRGCGKIFCSNCCDKLILLPAELDYPMPERVCVPCFKIRSSIDYDQKFEEYGPADAPTTVLLLHPGVFSRKSMGLQVAAWQAHYRLLVPDLPHHGSRMDEPFAMQTAVDQVASLLRAQAPGAKAVIFGVQLGGLVAMLLAGKHPELCAVVIAVSACAASPVITLKGATCTRITTLPDLLLRAGVNEAAWTDVKPAMTGLELQCTEALHKFAGPVLLVNGTKDGRENETRFLTAAGKGARLRLINGGDHLVAFDNSSAAQVNQMVLEFADSQGCVGVGLELAENPFRNIDKKDLFGSP